MLIAEVWKKRYADLRRFALSVWFTGDWKYTFLCIYILERLSYRR